MQPVPSTTRLLSIIALVASLTPVRAQFTYSDQDLILGFRQNGDADNLEINLGQASLFYNAAPGSTFSVGSAGLLNSTYSTLDSLQFSVSGTSRDAANASADHPLQTLWMTRGRDDAAVPSTPWSRQSTFALGNTGAKVQTLGNQAVTYALNNPGAVAGPGQLVVSGASGNSYSRWAGSGAAGGGGTANFNNTFQGNAEGKTPADFHLNDGPARSDLYEINPGSGSSEFLGYFELQPNGNLSFNAAPAAVPEPGTLALFGAGAFLLMAACRRRAAR